MRVEPDDLEEGKEDPHVMYVRREVKGIVVAVGLDQSLIELSVQLFKQASASGIEVVSLPRIAAGCLLTATKMQNTPVSHQELADVSHSELKAIRGVSGKIADALDIKIEPVDPVPFIKELAREAELSNSGLEWALQVDEEVRGDVLGRGLAPSSYAAAMVYCASNAVNDDLTQAEISDIGNVSKVTIRNNYTRIEDAIDA